MFGLTLIVGNLGRDPEEKKTKTGLTIANLNVAVSRRYKEEDETEWYRVTVFGKTAENCIKYLAKGSQVLIQGRMKTDSWADKATGETKYSTKLIADQVKFLSKKVQREEQAPPTGQGQDDDDIPF